MEDNVIMLEGLAGRSTTVEAGRARSRFETFRDNNDHPASSPQDGRVPENMSIHLSGENTGGAMVTHIVPSPQMVMTSADVGFTIAVDGILEDIARGSKQQRTDGHIVINSQASVAIRCSVPGVEGSGCLPVQQLVDELSEYLVTMVGCTVWVRMNEDKTRQDKTRQDKTRQDKTRQDKKGQDKTRQDTNKDNTRQVAESSCVLLYLSLFVSCVFLCLPFSCVCLLLCCVVLS